MKKLFIALTVLFLNVNLSGQTKYQNEKYGFSGQVPSDWNVYAEIEDNAENKSAMIDWGLPKVFSELEKASIENAISITAYKRADIKNIDDLTKYEFDRIGEVLVSKELVESTPYPTYIVITSRRGHKYKTQTSFAFKNNTGYVLNFTATPGTYDINLPKFAAFKKDVQFTEPKSTQNKTVSNSKIYFDGLYVAKTGEVNLPDKKMEIYNYIRFYDDGTVYTQAVNSYDPPAVSKWLGKKGRFERKGAFTFTEDEIKFTVNNSESPDNQIEGPKADNYNGKITDPKKVHLTVKYASGEIKDFWFEFVKD